MRLKIFSVLALLLALGSPALAFGPSAGDTFNGGTINQGLTNNGGTTQVGSTVITAIGTPTAPVVTPITTGSTSATYYCDGLDINGLTNLTGGVGNTLPSLGTTITNGNATPDTTVVCGGQKGALGYVVTKGATGGATSLLGSCINLTSNTTCTVTDTGQTLTTYTANSVDKTGGIYWPDGTSISEVFYGGSQYSLVLGATSTYVDVPSISVAGAIIVTYGITNSVGNLAPIASPEFEFNAIYSAAGTPVPTCNSGQTHQLLCVSDSTACTNLTTYTSGGATNCHLHCDGTNWKEDGFGC